MKINYLGSFISLALLLTTITRVHADTLKAPEAFSFKNSKAVFMDIKEIKTTIVYDIDKSQTTAKSKIYFMIKSFGYPIFDLKPSIINSQLDSKEISIVEALAPKSITKYRVINKELEPGSYQLEIENRIDSNIKYNSNRVSSAFWMSDLEDQMYIEQYLPTNIEFDQYKQIIDVEIKSKKKIKTHEVYTNGVLTNKAQNSFNITFPEYFTSSSFYFHLTKKDNFKKINFTYTSISGKAVPITIYAKYSFGLKKAKKTTLKTLLELENKFGYWAHPSFIAYIAGSGGMEFSGATITSQRALAHEITHSYFARGVMPIDGNSGWIDEAIASWRDKGYKSLVQPNFKTTNMASQSQYKRSTDKRAYKQGANFMAYLNSELQGNGGLTPLLNRIYNKYLHRNLNTQIFIKELNSFTGRNFQDDFDKYIYGLEQSRIQEDNRDLENPFHPKLTKKYLLDLL